MLMAQANTIKILDLLVIRNSQYSEYHEFNRSLLSTFIFDKKAPIPICHYENFFQSVCELANSPVNLEDICSTRESLSFQRSV